MDMQLNKELLRQERERRAWTQSHLAEVAGLSLRTIQRIERSGVVAKESAMALAGALGMELVDLLMQPAKGSKPTRISCSGFWGGAGILAVIFLALGWLSTAAAEPVMIKLSVKTASGASGEMQLLNQPGEQAEVIFDQQFRLLVTATRQEQYLRIATEIYDFIDGGYQLVSTPEIVVADNELAGIHLDTKSSGRLELGFTADY